jgi:hypothetical protein
MKKDSQKSINMSIDRLEVNLGILILKEQEIFQAFVRCGFLGEEERNHVLFSNLANYIGYDIAIHSLIFPIEKSKDYYCEEERILVIRSLPLVNEICCVQLLILNWS